MKRSFALLLVMAPLGPACARQVSAGQIDAVYAAQQQQEAAERDAALAQQAAVEQAQQHQAGIERARVAAAAERERARLADAHADKARDQGYQDQLRAIDVQEKLLRLQAAKARVARENEFIDRDLQKQSAENDVIKSQADAVRNLSSGEKTLLEKTGDAEVKAQSGLFR
ncbi:DUF5384 family protein [Lichenicoccus sp.]|uniref:DUF5384 family protein n=1 Tax=Lichenicoccus sp. TaxID=2781899 RepID=UPI003D1532F1